MTKEEAIKAMQDGKKVSHTYFSSDEWMTMKGHRIYLEDGVMCFPREFWDYRTAEGWEDGYYLYEE